MRERDEMAARFAREYLDGLCRVIAMVDKRRIAELVFELQRAYDEDRQIFIIGNGGSAGTASHMACDLAKTVLGRKPDKSRRRFRVLSMTDNVPLITALANDLGYEHIFTEQLILYARESDLLLVITGSGNSPNIVKAVKLARKMGLRTAGLLGFDGGKVMSLLDAVVLIPDFSYGYVEDLHVMIDHLITSYFSLQFNHSLRERRESVCK
ncbi:MAG: SIS domain-containing protein [Deltaproteobacteria bacterium]|nr:SIS domain-containing protein [Deltaproteobacteria bacterium]